MKHLMISVILVLLACPTIIFSWKTVVPIYKDSLIFLSEEELANEGFVSRIRIRYAFMREIDSLARLESGLSWGLIGMILSTSALCIMAHGVARALSGGDKTSRDGGV